MIATVTVLADINTAPIAGFSRMPQEYSAQPRVKPPPEEEDA